MNKLLDFLRNYLGTILGVVGYAVLSIMLAFYLSLRQGLDNYSFLFWLAVCLVSFALAIALFLLFYFINKKRKSLANTASSGNIESELKGIFRKLKRERGNFKRIPLVLFVGTGESSGDELFSRASFNLIQLNKKQDSGFSVWYSPEFMVLDVGPEFFDIACASSPLNKKFIDLLKFLRKSRRHAPINSYVMSLPFNYFSHTDRSDLENNAKNIAKKLEYIQNVLRIRFPAYLLIDRVDLVYGFYDYATSLGDDGSKQMVGWSSELKVNEVLEGKSINSYFEEFSNNIYKPLYREQSKLHLTSGNTEIPSFCFCKTIKNIVPSLKCFIENVFSNASWHFNPLQLRGVYFAAIKSDDRYSYMSYSDVNSSQLRYSRIPVDKQSQKPINIKDKRVFFLEDLFRNKILKESSLIVYTDSFLLYMKILKVLSLVVVGIAIFLFIRYSLTGMDELEKGVMEIKSKSWRACSGIGCWENGKFSPILLSSGDGNYSLKKSTINGMDSLAFVLDFYKQNDVQINVPVVYLLSEWIVGLNKQKNKARNTILYTSVIKPLLEAFLREYAVTKVNKFDDLTSEIFSNVFEYAKILCDYAAGEEKLFPCYLGSGQISGLTLYLEDTYRYLLKNFDKNTDDRLKLLSNIKIDLQQLFDSDNLPYGIDASFTKLKKSKFMENKENYQNNILKLIDFCVQDYMSGSRSLDLHHHRLHGLLIREFLSDAKRYKKDEEHFFKNLSIDEIVERGKNLKNLMDTVDNIDMSMDKKTVVLDYSLVVREQNSIKDGRVLMFDDVSNTIKFDIAEEFRNTLFFELGLKRSLSWSWLFNEMLTTEQSYLFSPFYEIFSSKNNNFSKKYAVEIETLKSDLLYGLALKNLINLLSDYNKKSKEETINNIFVLLDSKEIKRNENIDFVIRYLIEFSVLSKYLDILSKFSFPFTLRELQPNEDLIRDADKLSNALDGLLPPDAAVVKEETDKANSRPIQFRNTIRAEQNLPPVVKQWVNNAKKIISFLHANRDFVSKVYLLGMDYSKDFKQNNAADVWVAVEIEQENSDYKSSPALTRTKDNFLLGKVDLTSSKPLKVKFYRTLEGLSNHESKEYLSVGTLPLLKLMIDNPNPVLMFNGEYSVTWKAAKFNKDIGIWISRISFVYKGQKEFSMYIAFTMPEGAECLSGCVESEDQRLILKRVNEVP